MSNVHEFPDSRMQQWQVYERYLRPALAEHTIATVEEIDYAMERLRPIYLDGARSVFASDATGEERVRELNLWVAQQVVALMFQIAARDCELFSLRGIK